MKTRLQVINYVHEMLNMTFLEDTIVGGPAVYGTAVSTTCNLKCPFCMREAMGIRENKHMDFDAFASWLEQLRSARRVSLFGLGEPFLHPRFFDFVAMCKREGIYVATSTHGMSLTPEVRERIVELGLDELNLSIDAASRKKFEWLRKGAVFDTVVEQVTALAELKRARGVETPFLNINVTVHAHNVDEIPAMIRLAHRMGCQSVSYSSAVIYRPEDEAINVLDTPVLERRLAEARALGHRYGIGMYFWRQKARGHEADIYEPGAAYGCGQLNSTLIIERSGKIKTCCYIEEYQGDAWAEGPHGAFNNENMRRQRRMLMNGRVRTDCQGCVFLRERTPFWVQSHLNEAARVTETSELLTEEDRVELRRLIARYQARKDALYPTHRARPALHSADTEADEHLVAGQPVY